LRKEPDAP